MWVDQSEAAASGQVLRRKRGEEGGFPDAGLTHDVDVGKPIALLDPEAPEASMESRFTKIRETAVLQVHARMMHWRAASYTASTSAVRR
ncbi:hypothetical protein GALL_542750 [mine drainage metagenome]|uniref:Uncharacterized protein n=1 Tax=mine drainage metagenome TaxID=410659 RepID=A0A1J5NY39_9ZZZZ